MAQSGAEHAAKSGNSNPAPAEPASTLDVRILGLDGFRGLLALMVVISHNFAELPHGIHALSVGRTAVICFFVLSGFLIGRMILEKEHHGNFFAVFYARRFFRIVPAYVAVIALCFGLYALLGNQPWMQVNDRIPLWAYLTFTQNFFMVPIGNAGSRWLAPTWSLAVEEQFYIVMPLAMVLLPRRHLVKGLIAVGASSLAMRIAVYFWGVAPTMMGHVMLPALTDTMLCGVVAAILFKTPGIDWKRYDFALRITPVVMMVMLVALAILDRNGGVLVPTFGITLAAIAAASLILAIVRDAPEAKRFCSPTMRFLGSISYVLYLSHLVVLGLMHGLVLGKRPELGTWSQFALSTASVPLAILLAWIIHRLIEKPFMALGHRWEWSKERRREASIAGGKTGDISMATA